MDQYATTSSSLQPSFELVPPTPIPISASPSHPHSFSHNASSPHSSFSQAQSHLVSPAVRPTHGRLRSSTTDSWTTTFEDSDDVGSMELDFGTESEMSGAEWDAAVGGGGLSQEGQSQADQGASFSYSSSAASSLGPHPDFLFGTASGLPLPSSTSGSPSKAGKVKVSHARKTPLGHVKRPPNAFILFRSHCCDPTSDPTQLSAPGTPTAEQLQSLGITDHRNISRIVSHLWKGLTADERAYWEQRAVDKKDEHRRLHPDYRYKPVYRAKDEVKRRRKGDEELRLQEEQGCEQVARALLEQPFRAEGSTSPALKAESVFGGSSSGRDDSQSGRSTSTAASKRRKRAPKSSTGPSTVNQLRLARETAESLASSSRPTTPQPGDAPVRWTLDTVRQAFTTGIAPPPPSPLPKKKRIRAPRASRSKAALAEAAAKKLAHQAQVKAETSAGGVEGKGDFDGSASDWNSSAPQSEIGEGDEDYQQQQPFGYMGELDAHHLSLTQHVNSIPSPLRPATSAARHAPAIEFDDSQFSTSPAYAYPGMVADLAPQQQRPMTAQEVAAISSYAMQSHHSLPLQHQQQQEPPAPHELPYNPESLYNPLGLPTPQNTFTMSYTPTSQAQELENYNLAEASLQYPASASFSARRGPAGPQVSALPRGVPLAGEGEQVSLSPTNSSLTYQIVGPVAHQAQVGFEGLQAPGQGMAAARAERSAAQGQDVPSELALAGLRRRDTLRGTAVHGGQLTLVSPMTSTFDGRRFSLNRYEVRRLSTAPGGLGGPRSSLSNSFTTEPGADLSFPEFDQGFLSNLLSYGAGQGQGSGAPYMERIASEESNRPSTAQSDCSTGSETSGSVSTSPVVERAIDPNAGAYWKQQQQLDQDGKPLGVPSFHVSGADYFVTPDPSTPLNSYPIPEGSPAQPGAGENLPEEAGSPTPVFGSAGFENFFVPTAHRLSIDAQLTTDATDSFYATHYANSSAWLERGARGSDATIRPPAGYRRSVSHGPSPLQGHSFTEEGDLDLDVDVEELYVPQGMEGRELLYAPGGEPYYYLTKEESRDMALRERILSAGISIDAASFVGEEREEYVKNGGREVGRGEVACE